MAKYRRTRLSNAIAITKALGDEQRVRALLALRRRELCACQLTELLQLAPSTVSKHMSLLRQAHLIEVRKEGRWVYYRQTRAEEEPSARAAIEWLERSVKGAPQVEEDGRRLKKILKLDPGELCRIQSAS